MKILKSTMKGRHAKKKLHTEKKEEDGHKDFAWPLCVLNMPLKIKKLTNYMLDHKAVTISYTKTDFSSTVSENTILGFAC